MFFEAEIHMNVKCAYRRWLWCSESACYTSFSLHFTFFPPSSRGELLCLCRLHKLQPVRTQRQERNRARLVPGCHSCCWWDWAYPTGSVIKTWVQYACKWDPKSCNLISEIICGILSISKKDPHAVRPTWCTKASNSSSLPFVCEEKSKPVTNH